MKIMTVPALALAACVLSGGSAFAHAHLRAGSPAADAVVASAPKTLSLTFSEGLEVKLSGVTLKGSDGQIVPTGMPSLGADDDKLLIVPIEGLLGAGKYTVEWHTLSKDGHTSRGSYQFSVGP